MKNRDIKYKLNNEVSSLVPNVLDNILEKCEKKKGFKEQMNKEKASEKKKIFTIPRLAIGLCAIVLVMGIFGFNYYNNLKVMSVIEIDVNPSIELEVNKEDKIIKVAALNDDAKKILDGMDLEKVDLDVAVNALIGSMIKNGYLTIDQNSILVSVNNGDLKEGERIQKQITEQINNILKASSIDGSVLSQEFDDSDKNIEKLSNDYNISVGKAKLISNILSSELKNSKGELYDFDTLAGLSINELNLLINEKDTVINDVGCTGNASSSGYIGENKALEIALEDASVKESSIVGLEIEFDAEKGVLLYEVEFNVGTKEYEYDINAKTGKIMTRKIDDDYDDYHNYNNQNNNSSNNGVSNGNGNGNGNSNYIGKEKAKNIALGDANISSNNIREYEIELDTDDGIAKYEIDFKSGNKEYSYEINATTGNIIDKEIEIDD